ncbi:MAG: PAS domain-containing protein [Sporocytophaga sp.]|uniref:PAS domain-containing protein n=1 Tax=Sporocytophaga sp. TaxID=2231183 RepID=UPI001B06E962|nr:PAS domain-containing protein [Sporocytophaga sp.]MBO9702724.1 PAS domain-containing protein [Sporocytophaga sp.]
MNYKEIFDSAPTPLIVLNDNGTIWLMNERAQTFLGITNNTLQGTDFIKLIDQSNDSFENFYKGLETKSIHLIKSENGSRIYTHLTSTVITFENKEKYILCLHSAKSNEQFVHDLKERVKEQLAILNVIHVLFRYSDIDEALANCLPAICDGWRFPESTVARIELSDGKIFATKNFVTTEWMMQESIDSTEEKIGILKVGYLHEVPLYGDSFFLFEESRLITILSRIIGLFIKQWRVSNAIKENEELIKKITNQSPGNTYMFEIDENGNSNILFVNRGTDEYNHSYDLEYLVEHSEQLREVLYEGDKIRFNDAMKAAYHSNTFLSIQYRIYVNNVIRWRWLKAIPEKTKDGKVIWYGASHDITTMANYINTTEQILFDISHVIRRPIASILGLTNLVENTYFSEDELREISGKLHIVANELDKFLHELNHIYYNKREASAALNFDFSPMIDKRSYLFRQSYKSPSDNQIDFGEL